MNDIQPLGFLFHSFKTDDTYYVLSPVLYKAAYSSNSDYAPSEPPCNPQVYLLSAKYKAPGQTDSR